jgi:hypothetical protein
LHRSVIEDIVLTRTAFRLEPKPIPIMHADDLAGREIKTGNLVFELLLHLPLENVKQAWGIWLIGETDREVAILGGTQPHFVGELGSPGASEDTVAGH